MKQFFSIFVSLLIFFSSSWFSGPLQANTIDKALEQLIKGKELYFALQFEKALSHLESASALFQDNMEYLTKGEHLFDSHLYSALCYFSKKDEDLARKRVHLAYHLNPKRILSEKDYPPPFVKFFKRATTSKPIVKMTRVEIHSKPAFATVYLNGFKMGMTPLIVESWTAGKHHVKIVLDDYQEWYKVIGFSDKKRNRLSAALSPIQEPKWITTSPLSKAPEYPESDDLAQTESFLRMVEEKTKPSWTKNVWLWSLGALAIGGLTYGLVKSKDKHEAPSQPRPAPANPTVTVHFP